MVATAAAAAALLIGFPITEDPYKAYGPTGKQAFLGAQTLKPVAGSPKTAAPSVMALSPDRKLVAAFNANGTRLRFLKRKGGEQTGALALDAGESAKPLMSWLARKRLLVFTCDSADSFCESTTVHVVNPIKRKEIRTASLQDGVSQVSTVGDHALVMRTEVLAEELLIFDREGAVTHPDTQLKGTLNGSLVSSADPGTVSDSSPGTITRVDPETGMTLATRQFPETPVWVLPRQGRLALVAFDQQQRILAIDPETLETVRSFETVSDVLTMSNGYLERGEALTAYSLSGKRLWSTPVRFAEIAGIGDYVYVQRGLDSDDPGNDPNYRLTIYHARSGKRVAKIPGRYVLDTPSWSSSQGQSGPRLDGGYVYIETGE
jgi:hypothetical protein